MRPSYAIALDLVIIIFMLVKVHSLGPMATMCPNQHSLICILVKVKQVKNVAAIPCFSTRITVSVPINSIREIIGSRRHFVWMLITYRLYLARSGDKKYIGWNFMKTDTCTNVHVIGWVSVFQSCRLSLTLRSVSRSWYGHMAYLNQFIQ